ncbi:DNA-binding transcriptional activator FeaR [compost metagenome]
MNTTDADEIIQYSLSQIVKSKGGILLKDLHDDLQLSERSFERKFKQSIGISPKLYARICRFKVSLNQLKNNDFQKLSDIAYENDYSDQSHFIRSFKEFAGFSPLQYPKLVNVVIENTPTQ